MRTGEALERRTIVLDGEWGSDYGARAGDDLALYSREGLVHPAVWPALANHVVHTQVARGPWIHLRSIVRHHALVAAGSTSEVHAVVVRRYERGGSGRCSTSTSRSGARWSRAWSTRRSCSCPGAEAGAASARAVLARREIAEERSARRGTAACTGTSNEHDRRTTALAPLAASSLPQRSAPVHGDGDADGTTTTAAESTSSSRLDDGSTTGSTTGSRRLDDGSTSGPSTTVGGGRGNRVAYRDFDSCDASWSGRVRRCWSG
jgi:hypothetical protein